MELLSGSKVVVFDKKLREQLRQKGFGELKERSLVLDLFEATFLLGKEKIQVEDKKGERVSESELLKIGGRQKGFHERLVVFSDLRNRGYCVKTGFKFGFDFRVYPRGKNVGEAHSQWVVQVLNQSERFSMIELSRMVRLAQNLKTNLLLAIVDSEDEVNYYKIERIVP